MKYYLENETLKVTVESAGAEVQSVQVKKSDGSLQEYMWEADPTYWGKTSPILFPFIGKLEGAQYGYQGKTYAAEKHGFARDMEFVVKEQKPEKLVLALESTDATYENYPFSFVLEVTYMLTGNQLSVGFAVKNLDEKKMYFNLGGHPAFACPLKQEGKERGSRNDCRIRLYGLESAKDILSEVMDISSGLTTGEQLSIPVVDNEIAVVDHIFDQDALVLANRGVTAIGFVNAQGLEYVRMEAPHCPVWGIWSKPETAASYICIEPWWGICDSQGYQGNLEERPFTNEVAPGAVWEDGYRLFFME